MFFKKILGFVSWPVSITQQNIRLVRLAVGTKLRLKKLPLSGWHYQNKSYPVVEIGCDSSIIISFFKILFKFYFERLFKLFFEKVHHNVPYLFTV